MSLTLDPVTIAPGSSVAVPVQNPNSVQTIIISNKAYIDAVVTGIDNAGPRWLIAGTQDRFDASNGTFNGSVVISGFNTANIPSTQVSVVLLTVYYDGDEVPTGSWPVSIPSQVVNNSVSVTSSVKNDGNAAGAQVVESTLAGSSGSNVLIDNDGTVTISQFVSAVLTALFQIIPGVVNGASNVMISDANHQAEVLGALKVDGTSNLGLTKVFGALQAMSSASLDNGAITTDGAGNMSVKSSTFSSGKITEFTVFSGSGPATNVLHGCAVKPKTILVTYQAGSVNFGTPPAAIPYAWNITTTTCNIAASNTYNWFGVAILD